MRIVLISSVPAPRTRPDAPSHVGQRPRHHRATPTPPPLDKPPSCATSNSPNPPSSTSSTPSDRLPGQPRRVDTRQRAPSRPKPQVTPQIHVHTSPTTLEARADPHRQTGSTPTGLDIPVRTTAERVGHGRPTCALSAAFCHQVCSRRVAPRQIRVNYDSAPQIIPLLTCGNVFKTRWRWGSRTRHQSKSWRSSAVEGG